jgi:flagellar biosynthesis protein FliR
MISLSFAQLDGYLAQLILPFVRILALISVVPVLGNRSVPVRVKIALAALITVVAVPSLTLPSAAQLDSLPGMMLLAREFFIGITLGFAVRIVFAAIEMCGELIGLQMGLSFAGYFDPNSGSGTAISAYLRTVAILLFLSINGHLLVIAGVVDSFERIPIALDGNALLQAKRAVALGSQMFAIALSLALPVIVVLLIANIGMGVMSRVAPQLNIFAVSFPLTLLTGLATLTLLLPYLSNPLISAIQRSTTLLMRP